MTKTLEFGLNSALPEGKEVAWGARAIIRKNGAWDRWLSAPPGVKRPSMYFIDMLRDRQAVIGDARELCEYLNKGPMERALNEARHLLDTGVWSPSKDLDRVLFEDERVCIVGNPNGSHGYLYLVAYWR